MRLIFYSTVKFLTPSLFHANRFLRINPRKEVQIVFRSLLHDLLLTSFDRNTSVQSFYLSLLRFGELCAWSAWSTVGKLVRVQANASRRERIGLCELSVELQCSSFFKNSLCFCPPSSRLSWRNRASWWVVGGWVACCENMRKLWKQTKPISKPYPPGRVSIPNPPDPIEKKQQNQEWFIFQFTHYFGIYYS